MAAPKKKPKCSVIVEKLLGENSKVKFCNRIAIASTKPARGRVAHFCKGHVEKAKTGTIVFLDNKSEMWMVSGLKLSTPMK